MSNLGAQKQTFEVDELRRYVYVFLTVSFLFYGPTVLKVCFLHALAFEFKWKLGMREVFIMRGPCCTCIHVVSVQTSDRLVCVCVCV